MRPGDQLSRILHDVADGHDPTDAREAILRRARQRRSHRTVARVAGPVLAAAAVGIPAAVLVTRSAPSGTRVRTVQPAGTTPSTAPPTSGTVSSPAPSPTTTTVPMAAAKAALDAYVAEEQASDHPPPDAGSWATEVPSVHSDPVDDAGTLVAVAAFAYRADGHPVQVLSYRDGRWAVVAALPQPTPVDPAGVVYLNPTPVAVADVTGDGRPDFLVSLNAADNQPGFVVAEDGARSRYVPFDGGPYGYSGSDGVNGNPAFVNGHVVSQYNDCTPYCAAGHLSQVVWTYRPDKGDFWAPASSG